MFEFGYLGFHIVSVCGYPFWRGVPCRRFGNHDTGYRAVGNYDDGVPRRVVVCLRSVFHNVV